MTSEWTSDGALEPPLQEQLGPRQLSDEDAHELLSHLDSQIERVVLARQDPITGLLPASTSNTVHGN